MMDYLDFFSLNENPFKITPDPFYFYPSAEHNETLSSLNYAIEQKEGFFMAVGEPGTGKTTILKIFIDNWKDRAEIALIMTPRLSPQDFLLTVLEDFKVEINTGNKNEIIKAFRDFLIKHSLAGKRVIIVVDEAQDLPDETLEELRLLSNLETEKERLLQIVLVGQEELKKRLLSDHLRQLNQRVTVRSTLRPLTKDATLDYINYRLIKAGKGAVTFDTNAKKGIYRFSNGIPRVINLIASRAMMAAYLNDSRTIRKKHIMQAVKHLTDESYPAPAIKNPLRLSLLFLLLCSVAFAVFIFYKSEMTDYKPPAPAGRTSAGNNSGPSQELNSTPAASLPQTKDAGAKDGGTSQKPPKTEQAAEQPGQQANTATVTVKSANVRAGHSFGSETNAWVLKGDVVNVTEEFEDKWGRKWYRIKTPDNREGWLSAKVVRLNR